MYKKAVGSDDPAWQKDRQPEGSDYIPKHGVNTPLHPVQFSKIAPSGADDTDIGYYQRRHRKNEWRP